MKLSIYVMVIELIENNWATISPADVARAKASKITDKNNAEFRSLVKAYENGVYDEDPQMLASELISLL